MTVSGIKIRGATLLSESDLSLYPNCVNRNYKLGSWWLKTAKPMNRNNIIAYVNDVGDVNYMTANHSAYIRPALKIKLSKDSLGIGDIFSIGPYEFRIITPYLAWLYDQNIGIGCFKRDSADKKVAYFNSDIRKRVNTWYKELLKRIKEEKINEE